jgi:NTE family protein
MQHFPLEPKKTEPEPADLQPAIGLALGGGSARGYAHVGVLQVLEQHGLVPALIAGTSFGAVMGALYASGMTADEIASDAAALRKRDVFPHVLDFGLHKAALFDGRRLEAFYDRWLEGRHFADLERKLVVVTTDVETGERVLLQEGPVARALRASTALPGIFCPVEIDGRRLVDGGLGSPVPLETLDAFSVDIRIGIGAGVTVGDSGGLRFVQRIVESRLGTQVCAALADSTADTALARLGKAVALGASTWSVPHLPEGALHLNTRPPISWLNFARAGDAITAGREAMFRFLPQLQLALSEWHALQHDNAGARLAVPAA